MATTYYFLEAPNQPSTVLHWLRNQAHCTHELAEDRGVLLNFHGGRDSVGDGGETDSSNSPLVSVFLPQERRRVLWTVGEVHFLAKKGAQGFSAQEAVRKRFDKWLRLHTTVFDQAHPHEGFPYYLEGGIQNIARNVFALPSGLEAIKAGQYFIAEGAGDHSLDVLCNTLRLRGIYCG